VPENYKFHREFNRQAFELASLHLPLYRPNATQVLVFNGIAVYKRSRRRSGRRNRGWPQRTIPG
jgi:hypothetical protein